MAITADKTIPDGKTANDKAEENAIALLFGVCRIDEIRSCDDLKYSTANEYCTVWAPIKLPTWGHIWQMALDIRQTRRPWPFVKMDHEAAYNQLPLDPEQTKIRHGGHPPAATRDMECLQTPIAPFRILSIGNPLQLPIADPRGTDKPHFRYTPSIVLRLHWAPGANGDREAGP